MARPEQDTTSEPVDDAAIDFWRQGDGRWRWRWSSADGATTLVSNMAYGSMDEATHSARACFPGAGPASSSESAGKIEHPGIAGTAVLGAVVAGALRRCRRR